jgi:hypothetical protein
MDGQIAQMADNREAAHRMAGAKIGAAVQIAAASPMEKDLQGAIPIAAKPIRAVPIGAGLIKVDPKGVARGKAMAVKDGAGHPGALAAKGKIQAGVPGIAGKRAGPVDTRKSKRAAQ